MCISYHEVWPTRTCLMVQSSDYICMRCKCDKGTPRLFSKENNMQPGNVPELMLDRTHTN